VSDRLIECLSEAGLPEPQLFSETLVVGGTDSPLYAWAAETLKSFRPQLAEMGIALGELLGIETLESSVRAAVVEAQPDCGTHSNLRMGQDLTTGSTVNRLIL
jgi:hypothetical protein